MVLAGLAIGGLGGACGADQGAGSASDTPSIVVTTAILGDVVAEVVGTDADVVVLMSAGVSPHDFQASARQVAQLRSADAVVANGGGLESGLDDVLAAAERDGVPILHASEIGEGDSDAEAADEPGDGHGAEQADGHDAEHADEHSHEGDPHFFTSPERMADAVVGLLAFLEAEVDGLDLAVVRSRASAYLDTLASLDREVEQILAAIPVERRVLVTNHDVLGSFAERYGFEVLGSVLPSTSTAGGASAANISTLAQELRGRAIPAVFVDASSSDGLARTLAAETPGVEVVPLFTESLGPKPGSDTYVGMVRTNAQRIAEALA